MKFLISAGDYHEFSNMEQCLVLQNFKIAETPAGYIGKTFHYFAVVFTGIKPTEEDIKELYEKMGIYTPDW